jgi:large subunit ribosomal protein L5
MTENKMREIEVEKVVVNIGVGEAGERLLKAEKVLEMVCKQKPIRTLAKKTNKDLGVRKGMPIGGKVTLRGTKAIEFLKTAFWTKDNKIFDYSFDPEGNFSFGIPEYTDFPNMKYDPNIGIFGMDICVTLCRKGRRIKYREKARARIPPKHRIRPAEAKEFVRKSFEVTVIK